MLSGPIARILLRYSAGALVTYGFMGAPLADRISADPDMIQLITIGLGAAASLASELGYALARRWGWAT